MTKYFPLITINNHYIFHSSWWKSQQISPRFSTPVPHLPDEIANCRRSYRSDSSLPGTSTRRVFTDGAEVGKNLSLNSGKWLWDYCDYCGIIVIIVIIVITIFLKDYCGNLIFCHFFLKIQGYVLWNLYCVHSHNYLILSRDYQSLLWECFMVNFHQVFGTFLLITFRKTIPRDHEKGVPRDGQWFTLESSLMDHNPKKTFCQQF